MQDKIALVTGSGSPIGFGRAIATTLADEGCDVVCADLDLAWAEETAAMVESPRPAGAGGQGGRHRPGLGRRHGAGRRSTRFGRIDILVNNAGTSSQDKPFMQKTKADWDLDIGVNLYGQMNVAQAVIPHMAEQGYGRIVNTSGRAGPPDGLHVRRGQGRGGGLHPFAGAGGGAPGDHRERHSARSRRDRAERHAPPRSTRRASGGCRRCKRLCTPQDVAPAVAFLASDVCSYMVGQWIRLGTF